MCCFCDLKYHEWNAHKYIPLTIKYINPRRHTSMIHLLLGSTAGSRFSPGHLTVKEREIIQCQCQFMTLPKLPLIEKKRKLMIKLQHSRVEVAALPSLPMSGSTASENMSVVLNGFSDGTACVRPIHTDPECTSPSLNTPPSVNKPNVLSKRTRSDDSEVCKPLFQSSKDEGKAIELGDEVTDKVL